MIALAGMLFASCQQNTAQDNHNGNAADATNQSATATPSPDAPVLTLKKEVMISVRLNKAKPFSILLSLKIRVKHP